MNLLKKGEAVETSQPAMALNNYQKAHAFSGKINFTKGYFESLRLLAYQLNNMGRHDEARKIALAAVQKARQDTSKRHLALSYFAVANTALFMGRYQEAIPNYQKAVLYMRQIGNMKNVAVVNQNLGYIFRKQKMYAKALDYYGRALALDTTWTKDNADRRSIASDYFSIGVVYSDLEKSRKTLEYYRKAKQWIDPKNDLDFMVNLYSNIGYEHGLAQRYDSALYYRREALRVSRLLGNDRHELHSLMTLAETYNQMQKYTTAKKLLDESHALARKTKASLTEFQSIYHGYALANDGLGKYEATVQWLDKYIVATDSLNNQETKSLLQDYEVKLKQAESRQQLAERQRSIDQLREQQKRQNLWLLVAGLVAFGTVSALVFTYLYTRQRQRTADNALLASQRERELAVVQSELQGQQKERLRISKEMHDDLGASLTAIGLLSEVVKTRMGPNTTPEVEKISSISADMVTAMNEIIWSLNTKNDSLNGLIAYTRSYASEFIDNTSLTLRTEVEESAQEIPMRGIDRRNVFLTVKEALNNVVKHAQATRITLRMQPEADQLAIEVCDNGRGFTPNGTTSLRNGLGNMQNRMIESGGRCEIIPSSTGTCVKITYPYSTVPAPKILQT
ncbi:tetratricopeptide repeat-containing sensor histidine kinase [Spirosoma validum]|uniref:Tetratricopeptide repeat protein n=1 Tax=Spirosoma validum TaxID=2771355 RepID=A0A927B2E2_9BACT|nr:tetratricopeptide repeat protein [Spirosoma validum]MBD2754324.1 tetratricopeptide repeat protein [Spirosoma validum]